MSQEPFRVTAVIAKTSVPFVQAIFRLYAERRPFVIAASRESALAMTGIAVDRWETPGEGTGWIGEGHDVVHEPGPAQISFTSGTTGRPKGIVLDHGALADTVERLNAVMEVNAGICEYVGVPASFSFGLGRFRAVAAAGGRAFVPAHGFDPAEIGRMLHDGEINALSAVPTLLRLLMARPETIGRAGDRMRWIEIGSQHMTRAEKETLKRLFPAARIVQHYGLTEASRTTFLDISRTEGRALESVGRPYGATEIALAPDERIRIRGPHVARRWLDQDGDHPLLDEDGWLTTNDLGAIEDGALFFRGRADDLINCGGVKLVPDLVEERLRSVMAVSRGIAVARVPDAMRGDGVLVAWEDDLAIDAQAVRSAAKQVLGGFGLSPGNSLHLTHVPALPVTPTGKVQRGALARMADEMGALAPPPHEADDGRGETDAASSLRGEIAQMLGRGSVPDDASFVSLGGDSLSYVQVATLLDTRLGHLPENWERLPIASLQAMEGGRRGSLKTLDSSIVVRALAILVVVLDHAWKGAAGGASVGLMLVAGMNFSRFQVPKILEGRARALLAATFWRVMLPYYTFVTLTLAYHHRMFWPQYLLVSNFTEGVYGARGDRLLVPYWFMEDYLLFVFAFTLALSWKPLARIVRSRPWQLALGLFLAALALGIVGAFFRSSPVFYETTPFSAAWLFLLGWLIHQADDAPRRRLVGTLACVALVVFALIPLRQVPLERIDGFKLMLMLATELGAVGLLIFVRRIVVPGLPAALLSALAAASLYIYMSHPFVLHFISQKGELPMAVVAMLASAVVGVAIWRIASLVERRVLHRRKPDAAPDGEPVSVRS